MEGRRPLGCSSSSSSSSSSGIFGSIFAPSSRVVERKSVRSHMMELNPDFQNKGSSTKPENFNQSKEGERQSMAHKSIDSIFPEERAHPCHLSSSIYYGGRDVYVDPQNTHSTGLYSSATFKKDGADDDDADIASRGNWWQGSLYY
ncbi:hypothetical protein Nepgr_012027 [Nepenthes gracilis]|uniref:Uncharacterized protein n=1 Tax=Nepenthes gracilis TaxID=150966 RepID=A0AAD3XMW7_NEPGR|nr:hypothetical protein Nepgr_012027 [Nepenthes gracilis]